MTPLRVVIVGYGMAGARFADAVRRRDPDGARVHLTVIGDEPHSAYNRVLLSSVVAGMLAADDVRLHDETWARRHGVDLRLGNPVVALDRANRRVLLRDGRAECYDILVLATGSRPRLPPLEGLPGEDGRPADGVHVLRTLDDAGRLAAAVRRAEPVAVLGGGLLGVESACALADIGVAVTLVHPADRLMGRQLDTGAGRALARGLTARGVGLRLGVGAAAHLPGDGLKLTDGGHVRAGTVLLATGVRPNDELAGDAGLAVDAGVVVDDALCTDDPAVHALGDCARHPGGAAGLVQPAWEQAEVLADRLTGAAPAALYRGSRVVTRLAARDIELTALGEVHTGPDDPEAEVVRLEDTGRGRYGKLVVRRGALTGAILLGLPDAAAAVVQLYDRGDPVPEDRLALLLGRALPPEAPGAERLPSDATVCRCNSVTKEHLVRAFRAGAVDEAGLAAATRAGTGCGGCAGTVRALATGLRAGGS